MLMKLREKEYVNYEKYGEITLTPESREIAVIINQKHTDLESFLKFLGVEEKSASLDACKIEHVIGQETMEKMRKLLKFVEETPEDSEWLKKYKKFVKNGESSKNKNKRKRLMID